MSSFPPPPPPTSAPSTAKPLTRNQTIALVAGVVVVLGSVLPWAKVLFFTLSGTDGDGKITLVLGALAIGGLFVKKTGAAIAVAVLFLLAAGIGIYDYANISSKIAQSDTEFIKDGVTVGIGLYLVILGGVAGLVSALLHRSDLNS